MQTTIAVSIIEILSELCVSYATLNGGKFRVNSFLFFFFFNVPNATYAKRIKLVRKVLDLRFSLFYILLYMSLFLLAAFDSILYFIFLCINKSA